MADPTRDASMLRTVLTRILRSQEGIAGTLGANLMADIRHVLALTAPPQKWFMVPMFALIKAESVEAAIEIGTERFQDNSVSGLALLYQDEVLDPVEFDADSIEVHSILDFSGQLGIAPLATKEAQR